MKTMTCPICGGDCERAYAIKSILRFAVEKINLREITKSFEENHGFFPESPEEILWVLTDALNDNAVVDVYYINLIIQMLQEYGVVPTKPVKRVVTLSQATLEQ